MCAFVREQRLNREGGGRLPDVSTDIQAALTVLGRRANSDRPGFGSDPRYGIVELRNTDLGGANLADVHFEGAHLKGAHLDDGHLDRIHLTNGHLNDAVLYGTVLKGAGLQGADLTGAALDRNTNMAGVTAVGANFRDTELGAGPIRCNWTDVNGPYVRRQRSEDEAAAEELPVPTDKTSPI